ncbi:hypothetical protein [Mycobacterium sp. 1274756.6]|uniref:hypothetical protein n=1 Tax=Mycobacterium sp. 1274756.6 TaxID=1834076 RepID=UPI0007FBB22B|nr:hypothetical protein [Mycobacterium sp. 1274756.6]OBJ67810.1 hypothetical protein A5643_14980 [Mycobacterium sp. 1274756.6]
MEIAVRPAVTAGVALAAAGMIAVTPVASVVPDVQVPNIQLVGFADTLDDWLSGFNADLFAGQIAFNSNLVDRYAGGFGAEIQLEKLLFGSNNALNGVINRLYNVFNMGLGAGQNSLNGVLGTSVDPSEVTASLLAGFDPNGGNVFNTGQIGGLEGMFGQALQAFANATGFPNDSLMGALQDGLIDFNGGLVSVLKDFNGALVDSQLGLERMVSPLFEAVAQIYNPDQVIYKGADSILNGVVNRGFNTFNMLLDSAQQGFLGLLGADFESADITSSLLVTLGVTGPFNTGVIGGLEGFLGNGYMMLADLAGLIQALLGF